MIIGLCLWLSIVVLPALKCSNSNPKNTVVERAFISHNYDPDRAEEQDAGSQ